MIPKKCTTTTRSQYLADTAVAPAAPALPPASYLYLYIGKGKRRMIEEAPVALPVCVSVRHCNSRSHIKSKKMHKHNTDGEAGSNHQPVSHRSHAMIPARCCCCCCCAGKTSYLQSPAYDPPTKKRHNLMRNYTPHDTKEHAHTTRSQYLADTAVAPAALAPPPALFLYLYIGEGKSRTREEAVLEPAIPSPACGSRMLVNFVSPITRI